MINKQILEVLAFEMVYLLYVKNEQFSEVCL